MTKKDYKQIAKIIAWSHATNTNQQGVQEINNILSQDNPRYDEQKFWDEVNENIHFIRKQIQ